MWLVPWERMRRGWLIRPNSRQLRSMDKCTKWHLPKGIPKELHDADGKEGLTRAKEALRMSAVSEQVTRTPQMTIAKSQSTLDRRSQESLMKMLKQMLFKSNC